MLCLLEETLGGGHLFFESGEAFAAIGDSFAIFVDFFHQTSFSIKFLIIFICEKLLST